MNLSRLFIQRPIATLLLTLAVLCTGGFAYRLLPVSALPQVDYPTLQVVTPYPGAGPDTIASAVTAPLERQLGQASGLTQMYSTSSGGASTITLTFSLDTAMATAEQEVQVALNAAEALLPRDLPARPTYSKVNPTDTAVISLAATSPALPLTDIQDLLNTRVALKLAQISGVGQVGLEGGHRPAIRAQIDPVKLAAHGLTLEKVRALIANSNVNGSKGGFDGPEHSATLSANDQLHSAEEYAALILKYEHQGALTLGDVATLVKGPENLYQSAWANGQPAIIVNIQRQPGANVIDVVDRVRDMLPALQEALPASVTLQVISDRTETIRTSIEDVQSELLLSIGLVILVCLIFLRTISATLIPSVAVPLSLIGTFGVMYLAGFSLNTLTLMALTVATGFVIDDAIVMVENIQRRLEEGESPLQAALKGAGQIGFTIVSLTLSLVAVLIPLLFMGDVVGRLFREFSITLAVAILVSMVVSLTLTPMLCAYLLRHAPENRPPSRLSRWLGWPAAQFERLISVYDRSLVWVFGRPRATLVVAALTLVLTGILYVISPKGFFPIQDTGIIRTTVVASQDVSFAEMERRQQQVVTALMADESVDTIASVVGVDGTNESINTGRLTITLKPYAQRKESTHHALDRLRQRVDRLPGVQVWMTPGQDLSVDSITTPSPYQFTLDSVSRDQLTEWAPKLRDALAQRPEVTDVTDNVQHGAPMLSLEIDRAQASRYGITAADIDNALYNAYGQRLISTIFTQSNQYRVVLEVAPDYRRDPSSLSQLYLTGSVQDSNGNPVMIPLTQLVHVTPTAGYQQLTRLDQLPAVTLSFALAPGYSLEDAREAIRDTSAQLAMPDNITLRFQGVIAAFDHTSDNMLWLILAAVLTMYVVLGVLYESFIHPLTILSTLPSAAIGAFLALRLTGTDFTLIALIGLILLIGIVKKNAIMLVDFALEGERVLGLSPREAIHRACLLRFRPILMTTLAALLGALPLMLAHGAGSELRTPMGLVIVGGLCLSQLLTLYTTPIIYLAFDTLNNRWSSMGRPS